MLGNIYHWGDIVIKNKLKSIRHRCELNQKNFAELLEINYGQYNRYEKQKAQPEVQIAFEILDILKKNAT